MPETVGSRSIPIRLERKSRNQPVDRYRHGREKAATSVLRDKLGEWARVVAPVLAAAEPAFPEELTDRQWDPWEPMFAIADLTSYGADARAAAITLHGDTFTDASAGELLLWHTRECFNGHKHLSSDELLRLLVDRDDGPWTTKRRRSTPGATIPTRQT